MTRQLSVGITTKLLQFKQPAGTSRGIYTTRRVWYVSVKDNYTGRIGIGECAPLPDLSCDAGSDYQLRLQRACEALLTTGEIPYEQFGSCPSILFGIETAMLSLKSEDGVLFDTSFSRGEEGIPINGLVWMGSYDEMLARMQDKLDAGFRCVKLKIGAINFEKEIELIRIIRSAFSRDKIEIRVDANGGFSCADAMSKLERLAHYDLHSIEQPIKQHQWSEMSKLCQSTPLPIALDEELIGINDTADRQKMLDTVKPQYVILKPTLHGGIKGSQEWISAARERNIGSWITSALESNVGLDAISQFAAHVYGPCITMPQGLGTGALFVDNVPRPLSVIGDMLWRK